MDESNKSLIIPVYINEKIVIDMLAIIEDGFSTVSQISTQNNRQNVSCKEVNGNISSGNILDKLLKIDFNGGHESKKSLNDIETIKKEKIHTNVSLLSKFREYLLNNHLLKTNIEFNKIEIGEFIEIQGELKKNPLIEFLDSFISIFKITEIFGEKSQESNLTKKKNTKSSNANLLTQVKMFVSELKHSGTIDFILSGDAGQIVLSLQEQYLTNDNISEIIGGTFKIIGKVIAIYEDESESIDLLRKTTLSLLPENVLNEMFKGFNDETLKDFNFPEFRTKIKGPALIVIPIAIYA